VSPADQTPEPAVWCLHGEAEVIARFGSDARRGLSSAEATQRLTRYGPNAIAEGRRRGPLRLLIDQFADFMILVLIAAAIVSGLIGDPIDTVVILAIVFLNAIIGFVQGYRAEAAIAALRQMAALQAKVVRDGEERTIPASELVPGDLVLLEAGNAVPADLRLIEVKQLRVDEAALTGESNPIEKVSRLMREPDLPLGDRHNMAWKGTIVTYGRGRGVVVATGMETELGRIARLLREEEEVQTPLQKRLTRFGRVLSLVVLAICAIVFVTGILRGEPMLLMALTSISLAVAAIPEALPAVVTISLALGMRKMVVKHALIRKLPAVETLGSVTFVCADKTGTLTENRMRVEALMADIRKTRGETAGLTGEAPSAPSLARGPHQPPVGDPWQTLFMAMALSNDARLDSDDAVIGDPTEVALFEMAREAGFDKPSLERDYARVGEIPFDSERARMTTLHRQPSSGAKGTEVIAFTKGAPERLLPLCHDRLGVHGPEAIDRSALEEEAERMATEGLRVLAVAVRTWPVMAETLDADEVETRLTFVGLIGMIDPPRPEALEAVRLCQSAGITPVMITGDHPATARAVAQRLGIIKDGGEVITGRELARMDMAEFEAHVERVRVYARVAPEQKIKIVKALQDMGEYVAMTGDGVNDAPALRRANIGVAMGITGTDVAKEAGHMILLDDNFATIVAAVREGRRIFDNIRKFIKYTMTSNSSEVWVIFLAPFLGLPIPLLPIHILWINLVTDGLPGLALAAEPEERGVMQRPPRPPNESIFAHGMWQHMLVIGLFIAALALLVQVWALANHPAAAQTMVFTVLTMGQMLHVLAIRSDTESMWARGLFTNLPILGAVVLTFGLQLLLIYTPWLNAVFRTVALSGTELGLCLSLALVVPMAVEIEKALIRAGVLYRQA